MPDSTTRIVWFRRDLRTFDNTALAAACSREGAVRAVFLDATAQWREHDMAPLQEAFMWAHVDRLEQQLAALGIPLDVLEAPRFADAAKVLGHYCAQHSASELHFNREYELNERRRDKRVALALGDMVACYGHHDQTLTVPGSVLTKSGGYFRVFSAFQRAVRPLLENLPAGAEPAPRSPMSPRGAAAGRTGAGAGDWAIGEPAARQRLESFLAGSAGDYGAARDIPSIDGTSRLSPYLALGVVSVRECYRRGMDLAAAGVEGAEKWTSELIWRDFYKHLIWHEPDLCRHRPFLPDTDRLHWSDDAAALARWQAGETGVPIVDAGMRQLAATGWMHNRVRMLVASYLAKNLFLDWRHGERHFMRHLVDGDFAANNGGWQWSASTGTDAAPYFRVFNPVTQSSRFDAEGSYIRQWVPELADVPAAAIHDPAAAGVAYHPPLVDLKQSRQAAIDAFRALKDTPASS